MENHKEVIRSLKKEKEAIEEWVYEEGKEVGYQWAMEAEYEDLLYAAEGYEPMNCPNACWASYDNTHDELLGDYFSEIMESDDRFWVVYDKPQGYFVGPYLNDTFAKWEEGWVDGVREFWGEIKDEL
jgi:hypothetical protein